MKNQRENCFASKFHLLNSQENTEEIIWSCSDSSDYESCTQNKSYAVTNKTFKRKRKRSNSKNKANNLSNLNITFIESPQVLNIDKKCSNSQSALKNLSIRNVSPILTSQLCKSDIKSPILTKRSKENRPLSPVLVLKHSPLPNAKVRKKLFNSTNSKYSQNRERSMSPVLSINKNTEKPKDLCDKDRSNSKNSELTVNNENTAKESLNDTFESTSSVVLIEKVKSYFDSHFSSTTSQHSISECETSRSSPKSHKSQEVEVANSLVKVPKLKVENTSSMESTDYKYLQKSKKVKYKKDGLAYRLNALLKKQHASTSLWYHERFLAANSNFILPKEECLAFRIENVQFKYGCCLVEAIDVDIEKYLIYINNLFVKNNAIEPEAVLKLYKPYKILNFDKYKVVINVSKFECIVLKK